MYHGGETKRKVNPRPRANIFSLITFFYTTEIFTKGYRKDLEEDDIYETLRNFKSKPLGDELEQEYLIQLAAGREISIYKLLWKCYGVYYLFIGVLQFIVKITIIILQPRVFGKLVLYFAPDQTELTQSDAIYYACVVIALVFLNCFWAHNYMLLVIELGLKVRTAFSSLIYRKSLKLSASALSEITIGKIVTLVSKDVFSFDTALMFANDIWIGVIQILIVTFLIYLKLGLATAAGVTFFILVVPLQLYVGKLTSNMRAKASKVTDDRIQVTQETLSAIKIVKMYTWERFFSEKIAKSRQHEVKWIRFIYYAKASSLVIGSLVSKISLYVLIMTYLWMGNHLTAEIVFYIVTCLNSLRSVLTISIPLGISQFAELNASVQRIHKVLKAAEIEKPTRIPSSKPLIDMKNIEVKIKDKVILQNLTLRIDCGFNLITGKVGYGKSSLLKTILEDYKISQGNLKVLGRVSYASEEPWIFPSSIRQNIIFGQTFDANRYRNVLDVCGLTWDIQRFERGDETVAGDRGLNLSKGQQARINLARAVYKDSDIYLFDDCLSSLDANVQDFVFRECIKKFLADKIVLLVSHNQAHLKEADNVVIMENGTVISCAKPSEIPDDEIDRIVGSEDIEHDIIDNIEIEDEEDEEPTDKTKLLQQNPPRSSNIYHEEKKVGSVDTRTYTTYFRYGGGFLLMGLIFVLFGIAQATMSYTDKLVSNWTNIEQQLSDCYAKNETDTEIFKQLSAQHSWLMTVYTTMIVISTIMVLSRAFVHFSFCSRSSVKIHKSMISSVINAVMEFFDSNFIGNILNRFSKDIGTIDEYLPFIIYECMRLFWFLFFIIFLIATVNSIFLIPAAVILISLVIIRTFYIPTGRSLKRLDSATRSPVIGHINASLEGITTIRAYGIQSILEKEFDKHQDLYTSAFHMMQTTSRAFGFLLDLLCCLFISSIVSRFVFMKQDTNAGSVGLAISQAFMLTGLLQWAVRQWSELENTMTSVERVLEYSDAKQERKSGEKAPENWPDRGEIAYESVNLTYSSSSKRVLKDINFTISPGEKIGIVGRTGAGKSSIISTLFNLYDFDGIIKIDGVDLKSLSLEFVRSSIAIIPQDPVLFSGSIRSNIDPTEKYADEEIWGALETVKLKGLIDSLEYQITEGGSNFSSGQRQLLCLARAVITKNKIIVLDEATANMDPETDGLLHSTIQDNFHNCTVLTIAHRLHSVMGSDRVMVVDKGQIVEFESPQNLLRDKRGVFYKMVKQANLL